MDFAKVFWRGVEQVVVMIREGDAGPEIRFFAKPEGLGVCSIAVDYPDSDEGWHKAEKVFADVIDDEFAWKMTAPIRDIAKGA